jgi:UDP-N-acetyl-D-mannosaminuronic acid transferase (WecB/TagA/CpsF family)
MKNQKSKEEEKIHHHIGDRTPSRLLMLLGSGQQHEFMERHYPNIGILSIDSDPVVGMGMTKENQRFISIEDLCEEGKEKFDAIHLDYMCQYGDNVMRNIEKLYKIMDNQGLLFITLMRKRENILPKGAGGPGIVPTTYQEIQELMARREIILELETLSEYDSYPTWEGRGDEASPTVMITYGFVWTIVGREVTSIILPEPKIFSIC